MGAQCTSCEFNFGCYVVRVSQFGILPSLHVDASCISILKTLSANYGACAKDVDNEQFWSENEANFQN